MKLREIKQHNIFSIITIVTLLTSDLFSYYLSYYIVLLIKDLVLIVKNPYSIIIGVLFLFYFFNCYNPSSMQSRSREVKTIFNIVVIITFIYISSKIILIKNSIFHLQDIFLLSILFFIITILLRLIIRTIQKQLLHLKIGLKKVVVVGANKKTYELINEIKKSNFGYNIIGYFSNIEHKEISNSCKYLGSFDDIYSFLDSCNINEVIIALKNDNHNELLNIISKLKNIDVCIKMIPDTYDVITGYAKIHNVTGMPLIDINPNILTEFQLISKRLLDIIISCIALILFAIPMFIVAVLIKISSKGNIIFKQKRVGLNGREFIVHKFRTMYSNSEEKTGPVWASKNDPRITKVGKILRKTRLDEFPQLYDVLIGNMSIVGPRPERKFFVNQLKEKFPYYVRRLKIRPGITGWAQVMGDYDTSLENVKNKLKLDFYYIENISIWLDLKIMILTLWIMIKKEGH